MCCQPIPKNKENKWKIYLTLADTLSVGAEGGRIEAAPAPRSRIRRPRVRFLLAGGKLGKINRRRENRGVRTLVAGGVTRRVGAAASGRPAAPVTVPRDDSLTKA